MPNRPKPPQEIATTMTYSARPDYHIFLALANHKAGGGVNISMAIRHLIDRLVETDPHCAELFQQAGEIQMELDEIEGYLEQKPELRTKLQQEYGRKKNFLLEWRLNKPAEFQALLAQLRPAV